MSSPTAGLVSDDDATASMGLEMSTINVTAGPVDVGGPVDADASADAGAGASLVPQQQQHDPTSTSLGASHASSASRGDGFALLDRHGQLAQRKPCCGPWMIVGGGLALGAAVIFVLLASGSFSTSSPAAKSGIGTCAPADDMWRLPDYIIPTHYEVALQPLMVEPYSFSGSVSVSAALNGLAPSEGVECVYLNVQDLNVSSVMIGVNGGAPVAAVATQINPLTTIIGIRLAGTVRASDQLSLSMSFEGFLNRNMEGLYLSTYTDEAGALVPMVATQFEATSARRAFPCFDEPSFKAVFTVTLRGIPDGFTALSNMPEANVIPDPAGGPFTSIEFEPSVKMSSYLVAAVIGKMSKVEATLNSGTDNAVLVRVWARTSMADQLSFALDTAVATLDHYNGFFGVPFPLPKCDLVAVPDFAAGAMENWGLVTYRETALLGNVSISSVAELERVAVVVCHELAHQWFGNLVTMKWWDYLWLNEGFATYVEFIGVQASHPSYEIWSQFLGDNPQAAMSVDGYLASHPLSGRVVNTPQQIESQFDAISYSKGSSVIRMVASFMQSVQFGSFKQGLSTYLDTYKYGNTVADQLWGALSTALPSTPGASTLTARLQSYTNSAGVPVVQFEWVDPASANTGVGQLKVTQRRFFASSYTVNKATQAEKDVLWWIPLTMKAENAAAATGVSAALTSLANDGNGGFMTQTWATTFDYDLARDGYIKANLNQTGYYRVNYPFSVWQRLGDAIDAQLSGTGSGDLTADDRSGLVDDAFAMIYSGLLQTENVLSFVRFLSHERAYTVWRTAFSSLIHLRGVLFPDTLPLSASQATCVRNFDSYARGLVQPVLAELTWDGSSSDTTSTIFLRSSAIGMLSLLNDTDTINEAQNRFTLFKTDPANNPLDSNIQSAVFGSVVRWGGQQGYDDVLAVYRSTDIAAVKQRALRALASATTQSLLQAALDLSISNEVRKQDTTSLVDRVAYNPLGRSLAWDFVTDNWAVFDERYGSGGFAITSLITAISGQFTSNSALSAATTFWEDHAIGGAQLEVERAEESVGARALWVQNQYTSTCQWLATQ